MPKRLTQLEFYLPSWLRKKPAPIGNTCPTALSDPSETAMTSWCRETARELHLPDLAKKVTVSWNPRMRTTAGRAWWPARSIELNSALQTLPTLEIWRTLKHELAHLIAYERCGRRRIDPHGPEWKLACADLGIPGETTCHSLPLKGREISRNYSYACPACLTVIHRVRPMRRPVACYPCCKKFNHGTYHDRFRLIENKIKTTQQPSPTRKS